MIDVQQIIEYLVLLIEDASLRKTIGTAAVQYVSKHHHLTQVIEEYEHLWSDLREEGPLTQLQTSMAENQVSGDNWLSLLLSPISQAIDEDTLLQITPDGEALLETKDVIIYEEIRDVIFQPIILVILDLARSGTSLSKITQLFLEASYPEEAKDVAPNIAYHIIWCIKQGFMHPQRSGPIVM